MIALGQLWRIARLTYLEAVRQRFFIFLLVLSVAMVGSGSFFRQFDFGPSELKFVADFGLGGIFFFGSILSIAATAQLFFAEIENRTALTLLAKPVRRSTFIAGKLLGVGLLLLAFVALLTLLLGIYLQWRQGQIEAAYALRRLANPDLDPFPDSQRVQLYGLAVNGVLQWLKFMVLSAMTILFASYSNTNLFTVIMAFFTLAICQIQYIAQDYWNKFESPELRGLARAVSWIFPNFQLFNIGQFLIFQSKTPVPGMAVASAAGYGIIYVFVFLALAVFSFRAREI